MKKKEYIQPEVEIILLEQENVIVASTEDWGGEIITGDDVVVEEEGTEGETNFSKSAIPDSTGLTDFWSEP